MYTNLEQELIDQCTRAYGWQLAGDNTVQRNFSIARNARLSFSIARIEEIARAITDKLQLELYLFSITYQKETLWLDFVAVVQLNKKFSV